MRTLNISELMSISGGDKVLEAEGIAFGVLAIAAAVTGFEPVAVAAAYAAVAADAENYAAG